MDIQYTITINDIDYTKYAVLPLKTSSILDEELDEASITLKAVPVEVFEPQSLVNIVVTMTGNESEEQETFDFVLSSDNSIEVPVGSGKFNHTLMLVETTKILEGFIGDSLTFTNDLGNAYIEEDGNEVIESGDVITMISELQKLVTESEWLESERDSWQFTGESLVKWNSLSEEEKLKIQGISE